MDLMTITIGAIFLCIAFCAILLGSYVFGPAARSFADLTKRHDSFLTRILPTLSFAALLGILIKLTVF